ncbi:hypothetical protein IW261DRAFT_1343631, partial [Armillaria novae-zelandiae]
MDSIVTDASVSVNESDPSNKNLHPLVSSLINTPLLQRHGLVFHSHYRTIHCVNDACGTAVLPYALVGHLQNQHHFHFTAKQRQLFNEAIQELNPLPDASHLSLPPPRQAPVDALKVHLLGHCCRECLYAVGTLKTFQRHWSKNHRADLPGTKANEGYYLAPIQTFFTIPERYFEVNPALTKLSNKDPFAIFLKTVNPALEAESYNVLPAPNQVREVPPLLRTTGWHLHLKNYITDRRTVSSLLTLVSIPPMTTGSFPAKLRALVQQYMEVVRDRSQASPLGVRALLIDFHRCDQRGKLWSAHDEPDTLQDYGLFLFHFIYAIILSRTSSDTDYRFPLLQSDHQNADNLLVAIRDGTNQLVSLHQFILPLLSPRASSSATIQPDKWQLVIECFVAVFCLQSDGQFRKPEHTTQVFAKIKYLVRGTCLFEAYEQHALFENDLYLAVEHYAKTMLRPGSTMSPFNMAIDYQRLASYLAYSQSSPPATRVSEDCLTIFYRAHSLHVPAWRHGLQCMLAELVSSQDALIAGADQTMDIPPNIPDDWTDESRGYSWLKNSDCGVPQHALLQQLMANKSLNLVTIDSHGHLLHNIAAYHRLLAQISEITWLLAFLCYMVPGQVTRAMEFVDHKVSNSTRPRTIFRNGTDLWLVIRRAKYENNIGKAVFIPSLIPPQIQREFERYLLFIRPLERVLSATVYGLSSIHLYDEYLWVTSGQRITGDQFCKQFPHAMLKYCQCAVGIHDYRQLVVQISRTYLGSEEEMNDELEWDVFAAQRGHSVQTARRIYAPELGHLPSISSEALLRFASGSKDWWSVTGFIPGEPPKLPLTQRRQLVSARPLDLPQDLDHSPSTIAAAVDMTTHFQNLTATLLHQITSSHARMEERIHAIVAESMASVMLRMD